MLHTHTTFALVAMAGLPGTGKSLVADMLAEDLALPVIDKDDVLELVRETSIEDPLEQGRLSYDVVFAIADRQLRNGVGVIVDTCLTFQWLRARLEGIAADRQAPTLIVHCECPEEVAKERISNRVHVGFAHRNWEEYLRIADIFEDYSRDPDIVVDTTSATGWVPQRVRRSIVTTHGDRDA